MIRPWMALWLCLAVAGCASTGTPAPIIDRSQKKAPVVEAGQPTSPTSATAPSSQQTPAAPAVPRPTASAPATATQTDTTPTAAPPPRAAPAAAAAPTAPPQVAETRTTPPSPAAAPATQASGGAGKTPPAAAAPVGTRPEAQQQAKSDAAQTAAATTPSAAAQRRAPAGGEEPAIRPYREGDWRPEFYVVKKGDTLYSIALDHGQDYRDLALWNNLADPSYIQVDQRLRLFPPGSSTEVPTPEPIVLPPATLTPRAAEPAAAAVPTLTEPKARRMQYSEQALAELTRYAAGPQRRAAPPAAAATAPAAAPRAQPASRSVQAGMSALPDERLVWEWPTDGRLIYGFGEGVNHKGMGIDGALGQAVVASAPGKVVYSGTGLRGYGKLIIIKHNATYLSVYAHNSQLLVREGQTVAQGQKIAEMGDSDSDRVALHFEIRRLGKPVDPLKHLPEKTS